MPVSLGVSLSLAFAAASVAVATVAFTPTYLTGLEGVTETANALRVSIDKHLEAVLVEYLREPQVINDVLALEYTIGVQGATSPAQQQMFKNWCFMMLKANPNSLYISLSTHDGGRPITNASHGGTFLGCEVVRKNGQEALYHWHVRNETTGEERLSYLVDGASYDELTLTRSKVYDPRVRSWYTQLSKKQGWTKTYLYSDGSKFGVTSGKPVRDASGELLAVVTTDYAVSMTEAAAAGALGRSFSSTLAALQYGKTGAALAVDTRGGGVLGTSWEERLVRDTEEGPVPKEAVHLEHDMMKDVVAALGDVLGHPAGLFKYGGRWVSVQDIADPHGFTMRVVVAIPEADYLGEIREQQVVSIVIVVALVVVVVLCSIAFARGITSSVQRLALNMQACATMKLDHVEAGAGSVIAEVGSMQASFEQMHRNLIEYRNYLPQSVLLESDVDDEATVVSSEKSMASTFHVSMAPSAHSNSSALAVNHVSAALRNGKLTKKAVSVAVFNLQDFRRLILDSTASVHEQYLLRVLAVVRSTKGVVDSFQGDIVTASWNAVSIVGAHAAACVGAMWQAVSEGKSITAAGATGTAVCGNMGCDGMKKFTVAGDCLPLADVLNKMHCVLGTKLLVAQQTAEDAEGHFFFRTRDILAYRLAGGVGVCEPYGVKNTSIDEEWMYQLEAGTSADPYTGYNAAWRAVACGNLGDARATLDGWTAADETAFELKDRLETILREAAAAGKIYTRNELPMMCF